MKTRTLILVFLIMAVLIISGSGAPVKMEYISKDYEIYGTWVNPDYKDIGQQLGKIVFHPNGRMEIYGADTGPAVDMKGEFVITNKWIDSKGNIWYTIIIKIRVQSEYGLLKISNSGMTLELAHGNDYPKEINPGDVHSVYRIFYRQ